MPVTEFRNKGPLRSISEGFGSSIKQTSLPYKLLDAGTKMSWTKTHYMTVGFLAIFVGINLRSVETFVLSDQTAQIVNPDDVVYGGSNPAAGYNNQSAYNQNSLFRPNYQQAGYQNTASQSAKGSQAPTLSGKNLTPPSWLGWPSICVGSVMLLFGLSLGTSGKAVPDFE